MIKLGDKVTDRFSGFTGTVTGRAEYLYGCLRLMVASHELKDGVPIESQWFDEPQLELAASIPVAGFEEADPTGGPRENPMMRKDPV